MSMDIWLATLLAFCRIGSFLYFLPFFSGRAIPATSKIIFGLALSVSVADKIDLSAITTLPDLLVYALTQLIIGVSLAKLVEFLASIPKMAGHLLDLDLGLAQASLFDVSTGSQSTLLSSILDIFFIITFIALGGVNHLIYTIIRSFEFTASIGAIFELSFLKVVTATLLFAITSAVEIALPIMGSLFIINFVLLLIAKNAPQLNIFANAFAIKITTGLLLIGVSVPMLGYVFKNLTNVLTDEYTRLFDFFLTK